MTNKSILYLPIGVPTFHLESAEKLFQESVSLLHSIDEQIICPDEMLLSIDLLNTFIKDKNPDLIIIQNITFAHSLYATEILKRLDAPVLLWTLREPVIDGGRLRLNSLTGAFSAGFTYHTMKQLPLHYLFGAPSEDKVKDTISKLVQVTRLKQQMLDMNLLMIGHTPPGFGFGRALDLEAANVFGVNIMAIESRELTKIALDYLEEDTKDEEKVASDRMKDLDLTDRKNKVDFVKLYKAYKDYIDAHNIKAIASRCWPDFFTDFGTPVCGVLGMLNDDGIAAACEADAYGALSMYVGQQLSASATYLGDPVSIDEVDNTFTFWHCGTSACSLARIDTGALTGVHPNRKIGPTMEFGLKPAEEATIFRIGRKPDGSFRFFIASGEILDKPKQFSGTSMVVRVKEDVTSLLTEMVTEGWEPHFAVIYKDVSVELEMLAKLFNIEVIKH